MIIKGCAGLGNRLYTLSNAIDYAKRNNRVIYVDWKDGQFDVRGKNAFYEFFSLNNIEFITDISEIENFDKRSVYPQIWKKHLEENLYENFYADKLKILSKFPSRWLKSFPRFSMKASYWQYKENKGKSIWKNFWSNKNFIRGEYLPNKIEEDIVIFVDFSPLYFEGIIRENIVLYEETLKKIRDFSALHQLRKDTIGIHIRYTDKKPDSSFDKLYDTIEKIGLDGKKIFLSTDNLDIQSHIQKKYSEVIVYPKYLPDEQKEGLHQWALYNNEEDMKRNMFEESVIDMWLLAECEYLIYQNNSSFSNISRILKENKQCYPW